MLAMRVHAPAPVATRPLRADEIPEPIPAPTDVRVRVAACGVCRTDLHVVEGDLPFPGRPVTPGHQVVGVVDQVGSQVSTLQPGDRVGIAWLRSTCGACRYCQSERENLCERARFTGYHEDGGFAEYAVVPADFAYRIPGTCADVEVAPLLCAGVIGFRALIRANVPAGGTLAMFGFGSSAHITLQIARGRGFDVLAVTRNPGHQALALSLGATWAGSPGEPLPTRPQSAIVFAPAGELVPLALEAIDKGGTVALAGIVMSDVPRLIYEQHLFYEKNLRSVTANTRADASALLREAAALGAHAEVTTFPLRQANEALELLKQSKIDGTAVLVP